MSPFLLTLLLSSLFIIHNAFYCSSVLLHYLYCFREWSLFKITFSISCWRTEQSQLSPTNLLSSNLANTCMIWPPFPTTPPSQPWTGASVTSVLADPTVSSPPPDIRTLPNLRHHHSHLPSRRVFTWFPGQQLSSPSSPYLLFLIYIHSR